MNKAKALTLALGITGVLFLVFWIFLYDNQPKEMLPVDKTKEEVLANIENAKEDYEKTTDWIQSMNEDVEIGYISPNEPTDSTKNFDPKKDLVNYFIAGITAKDADIFVSCYEVETISQDLFSVEEPDKRKVLEDIINRISRDGKLKEVVYEKKKGAFGTPTNEIQLTLIYEDDKAVDITFQTKAYKDNHHSNESIYVITTSVWDIVQQIETAL